MKTFVVLALLVAAAYGRNLSLDSQWMAFKTQYAKAYSYFEEIARWVECVIECFLKFVRI